MYRKQKRIPTVIALSLIVLGIFASLYLEKRSNNIFTSAKDYSPPEEIHTTNISDSSMTVSWLTQDQVFGNVQISNDFGFKQVFFDDSDSDNIPRPRTTHFVTIRNLKEDTLYKLKIISGSANCDDQKCPVISAKTTLRLKNLIDLPPLHGQIFTTEGGYASEALVYIQVGKAQPLVSRTDSLGIWVVPLNNLRSTDFLSRPEITDSDLIQITARLNLKDATSGVIDVKSIRQNLPVPKMIIGKTYNFISLYLKMNQVAQKNSDVLGEESKNMSGQNPTPLPTINPLFDIAFPRVDMDQTPDKKPRLRGVAKPGSEISVTVNSTVQKAKIKVDKDGNWVFTPVNDLPPGIHIITIEGYNRNGKYQKLTKKFVVMKSGESILGESTPSASQTPTPSETPAATPSATGTIITVTPTIIPSATPSVIPTFSPTSIPTITPVEPTPPPPRSGNTALTSFTVASGAILLFMGLKFLLSL